MEEEDHTVSRAKDQPGGQVERMGELQALLARVLAASKPDRELDARIWCAVDPDAEFGEGDFRCEAGCFWLKSGGASIVRQAIELTASLDAALALVERVAERDGLGFHAIDLLNEAEELMMARGWRPNQPLAPQLAIAVVATLLAALLTALSHQQPHDQIREGEGQ